MSVNLSVSYTALWWAVLAPALLTGWLAGTLCYYRKAPR